MSEHEPLGHKFARQQVERYLNLEQQVELENQLPEGATITAVRLKREGVEVEAEVEGETVKVVVE